MTGATMPWTDQLSWLSPLVVVAAWCSLTAVVEQLLRKTSGEHRRLGAAVAGVGLVLAAAASISLLGRGAELILGVALLDGALWVDYLALSLDLIMCVAGLSALACRRGPPRFGSQVLLATCGGMLAAHAGDFISLVIGCEVSCLAVAGMLVQQPTSATRWLLVQAKAMACTWLGIALVYGAAGTLRWQELSLHAVTVFTKWGAGTTQKAVDILMMPNAPIGAGGIEQLRDAAVTGMAPAALFIPGLLLTLGGLCLRLGLFAGLERAPWPVLLVRAGIVRLGLLGAAIHLGVTVFNVPRLTYPPYGWSFGIGLAALLGLGLATFAVLRAPTIRRRVLLTGLHHVAFLCLCLVAAGELFAYAGLTFAGVRHETHYTWAVSSGEQVVSALMAFVASTTVSAIAVMAAPPTPGRGTLVGTVGRTLALLGFIGAPLSAVFFARGWAALAVLLDSNLFVRGLLVFACATSVVIWAAWLPTIAAMWRGRQAGDEPGWGARVVLWTMVLMSWGAGLVANRVVDAAKYVSVGVSMHVESRTRGRWVGEWYERHTSPNTSAPEVAE